MSLALFVYLISIVHNIGIVALFSSVALLFLGAAVALFIFLSWTEELDIKASSVKKSVKLWAYCLGVSLTIATILPTKQTMYLMAGAYAAQEVATSTVGEKVITVINQELDKLVEKRND